MQPLDINTLPLNEKVLIEASAGTGKTYTIGLIVLRLLLEKFLPIEKIVLITFTEAATAELKKNTSERIREYASNNSENLSLTQKANLLDAIARIDEMPVFTIHGFCKRLLSEFAYEIGNFEEMEIIVNQRDIENRVVADFWRREIEKLGNSEIVNLPDKFSPEILRTGIENVINFPDAKIKCEDKKLEKNGDNLVAELQHKMGKEFLEALRAEKKKLKVMGFDDLIMNAYKAVKEDGEKILFKAVQKKYEAILVDEFQDTDKMQFEIFSYLFKGKPFFMIGDPKQAIYRFRGGDIYAYLAAKKESKYQYTLEKNFRSQKRLLCALNKIFNIENPFENEDIKYINVESGRDLPELTINGKEQKPLVLRNAEYKNKNELNPVKQEIIREITHLLHETDTEIFDKDTGEIRKIKAQDIAILTRTNGDAKKYRDALRKSEKNIPAIIRRSDSVFKSDAADYIMSLLTAFVHSQKESQVKAALMENKELSSEDIKPFAEAFDIWKRYGIMRAVNSFFDSKHLWGKILNAENGERNATNLRQLIWILNEEEKLFGRVPERMLRRFAELIKQGGGEECEEKLETDDDAVQIMTIHTSKGLQFPIVFVPDIMLAGEMKGISVYERTPPIYHSKNDIIVEYAISGRKIDENSARLKEQNELLEESARNFYVAVTRPIYRLYIVNAHKLKLNKNEILSAGQKICGNISEDENIQVVDSFAGIEYPKSSHLKSKKEQDKELKPPKSKDFQITPAWLQTSFTAISQNLEHKDHTHILQQTEIKIPAGKVMGTLLHSIFENVDFDANENEIRNLVERKLGGFKEFSKNTDEGEKRKAWVEKQIKVILNKNLGEAGKLCEIDASNRVAELNFFMKAENLDLKKIKEVMQEKILDFEKEDLLAKYIKGAMDLVFLGKDKKYYILDWKSNSLGDFSEAGMEEAMLGSAYHLQYYIYAAALKRWLEQIHENFNFKEKFGGAYYIFVRGVNEINSDGIYFSSGKDIADSIERLDGSF
ncbi:MAG: UvrD-helicase domain-containing protein [Fibromonadaceae bacterium]|jgi:exodeoxyribonuclease V beta subunit|nr:UvrD-helicase domain-containing protein [Fibromonadaceae bacterium]